MFDTPIFSELLPKIVIAEKHTYSKYEEIYNDLDRYYRLSFIEYLDGCFRSGEVDNILTDFFYDQYTPDPKEIDYEEAKRFLSKGESLEEQASTNARFRWLDEKGRDLSAIRIDVLSKLAAVSKPKGKIHKKVFKWKNYYNSKDSIKKLYEGLIGEFVDEKTKFKTFDKIFSSNPETVIEKVKWKGNLIELQYLFRLLWTDKGDDGFELVDVPKQKWKTLRDCFKINNQEISDKSIRSIKQMYNQLREPSNKNSIDSILLKVSSQ